MAVTVTLDLPDEMAQRYQRGAAAAHKGLQEFLLDRLMDAAPPLHEEMPPAVGDELRAMEELHDDALWEIARSQLQHDKQRQYERLLRKNSQGTISPRERDALHALGEDARWLMLKKSHAYLLLKWRGHRIPSREEMRKAG